MSYKCTNKSYNVGMILDSERSKEGIGLQRCVCFFCVYHRIDSRKMHLL